MCHSLLQYLNCTFDIAAILPCAGSARQGCSAGAAAGPGRCQPPATGAWPGASILCGCCCLRNGTAVLVGVVEHAAHSRLACMCAVHSTSQFWCKARTGCSPPPAQYPCRLQRHQGPLLQSPPAPRPLTPSMMVIGLPNHLISPGLEAGVDCCDEAQSNPLHEYQFHIVLSANSTPNKNSPSHAEADLEGEAAEFVAGVAADADGSNLDKLAAGLTGASACPGHSLYNDTASACCTGPSRATAPVCTQTALLARLKTVTF
jgi:hypothetical protein